GRNYRGPKPKKDWIADLVSRNDDAVRSLPIYVGGVSLLAVLFNRTISGIAPVADASSVWRRVGVVKEWMYWSKKMTSLKFTWHRLTVKSRFTDAQFGCYQYLTGPVWLSVRPKSISKVDPQGVECQKIYSHLPDTVTSELLWAWKCLSVVTCCRYLVIICNSLCILQIGMAAESSTDIGKAAAVDTDKLMQGSLYKGVMKSGARKHCHEKFFWELSSQFNIPSFCNSPEETILTSVPHSVQKATWPTYPYILGGLGCHFCPQIHRRSSCSLWETKELPLLVVTQLGGSQLLTRFISLLFASNYNGMQVDSCMDHICWRKVGCYAVKICRPSTACAFKTRNSELWVSLKAVCSRIDERLIFAKIGENGLAKLGLRGREHLVTTM
ncbi:Cofactor assembly of complex C subunit B, CCB2/CCB4, partial [Dillenia turbinata]